MWNLYFPELEPETIAPVWIFAFAASVLVSITIVLVLWTRVVIFRRKSFWKALDYIWIGVAALAVVGAHENYLDRKKSVEAEMLYRKASAEIALAWHLIKELRSPMELGKIRLACDVKEEELPKRLLDRQDLCAWLLRVERALTIAPMVPMPVERYTANLTTVEEMTYALQLILDAIALGPFSEMSTEEYEKLLSGQPTATSPGITMHDNETPAEYGVRVTTNAAEQVACSRMLFLEPKSYSTTEGAKYVFSAVCRLKESLVELREHRFDLDREGIPIYDFLGSYWAYILALGLAIRAARTTGEFLIDFKDGK